MSGRGRSAVDTGDFRDWVPPSVCDRVRQTKYFSRNPVRRWLIRNYLEAVGAMVELAGPESLLDVGCGEGFVAKFLGSRLSVATKVGCDLRSDVLSVAGAVNAEQPFAVADAFHLPFRCSRFDLVMCNEVLEHLPNPAEALAEIVRVSRRWVLLGVPNSPLYRMGNLVGGSHWAQCGEEPDHRQRWTVPRFRAFVETFLTVSQIRCPFPWIIVLAHHR